MLNKMTKYEKVEMLCLGILAPLILSAITAYHLIYNNIAYFGRNTMAKFYGFEAYCVSLFWFGIATALFSFFFLKYKKHKHTRLFFSVSVSLILTIIGLFSAITFTFWNV
ncbi:MAG: hypothetical protein HWD86_07090 [Kangiellaceae bacterium]|nr:hypothetical protein [Kangiellaceae bacterium]